MLDHTVRLVGKQTVALEKDGEVVDVMKIGEVIHRLGESLASEGETWYEGLGRSLGVTIIPDEYEEEVTKC